MDILVLFLILRGNASRFSTIDNDVCCGFVIYGPYYVEVCSLWASQVAQWKRTHLPMQETWVPSRIWENPLEEEMAIHSSISYGQRSLAGYSSLAQKVMTDMTD